MFERRIAHLTQAHRSLDSQITNMETSGKFNDPRITEMKKKRLQIKDQIAKLKHAQLQHESVPFDDER